MSKLRAPYDLTCEYLVDPLGLDETRPRLAWKVFDSRQTAYRVVVSTLEGGDGDLWDTRKVFSDRSTHVEYLGKPLDPIQRAWWKVCVWDQSRQQSPWSKSAFWEAGLPLPNHWTGAKWIGCPTISLADANPPAVYLRKDFALARKRITR